MDRIIDLIGDVPECKDCQDCKNAIINKLESSVNIEDLKNLNCDIILDKLGIGSNFKILGIILIVGGLLLLSGVYFLKSKVMLLFTILILVCLAVVGLGAYILVKGQSACEKIKELTD
jgi:hypothetical protein